MKHGKIKFFRGQCDELIEEIKAWKWGRPVAGKECPAVGQDHYIDAMRYIIYALTGRRSESVPVEKSPVEGIRSRIINLQHNQRSIIGYDPVTGAPKRF